jgi:hypothetical protein
MFGGLKELKPISQLAARYGVKSVVFGEPGSGKTPVAIKTAPRPILLATEPGLLSVRDVTTVPGVLATTGPAIRDFLTWFTSSAEARGFDTLVTDSVSQWAEIVLAEKLAVNKDGRKAYGEMAQDVMKYLRDLYYQQQKHIVLVTKQTYIDENGIPVRKPYFPGKELYVQVPHLYDLFMHLGKIPPGTPNYPEGQLAFRTRSAWDVFARDRSGNLSEFEFPDFNAIFTKAMK